MAKTKQSAVKTSADLGIGDQVEHPKWGVGTVMFLSGSGENAKAIVVFEEEGQKKLILKFAKLKRIGGPPKSESKSKSKAKASPPPAKKKAPKKPVAVDDDSLDDENDLEDIFEDDDEKAVTSRAEKTTEET